MPVLTSVVNFFAKVFENDVTMTLSSSITSGATTVPVTGLTSYTDGDTVVLTIDPSSATLKQVFTGTKSGTSVINVVWTHGTNQQHTTGASIIDNVSATTIGMISTGILKQHTQLGAHTSITTDTISVTTTASGAGFINLIYPVGCIYTEITGVNPATTFGTGTWIAFGAGRVLIGVGTSDQTFSAAATGGESTHVLSLGELAVHAHGINDPGHTHSLTLPTVVANGGTGLNYPGTGSIWHYLDYTGNVSSVGTGVSVNNAGSGTAHNNLQPYIVVYFWKRTV